MAMFNVDILIVIGSVCFNKAAHVTFRHERTQKNIMIVFLIFACLYAILFLKYLRQLWSDICQATKANPAHTICVKKSQAVFSLSAAYYIAVPTLDAEQKTDDEEMTPALRSCSLLLLKGDEEDHGRVQICSERTPKMQNPAFHRGMQGLLWEQSEGAAAWKGYWGLPGGGGLYWTMDRNKGERHSSRKEWLVQRHKRRKRIQAKKWQIVQQD